MSIVDEFSKLSPQQQRETIQRLSQGSPEEANRALFLSRYVSEQQGLNVNPQTTVNPTQAKQIQETQTYNAEVYQTQQATQSNITQTTQAKPTEATLDTLMGDVTNLKQSDYWTRENPSGNRLIQNPEQGVSFTAKPGYHIENPQLVVTQDKQLGIAYNEVPNTIQAKAQEINILGSIESFLKDPFSTNRANFLTNLEANKQDFAGQTIKNVIKIGGLASLGAAPAVALTGAVISSGISQGFKTVQGGGLLTLKEVESSFFGGAAFSFMGAGANKALGLTGSGIKNIAGRTGVNTALGAGFGSLYEYAENKQVTFKGALTGAAFGAAFGLVGEGAGFASAKINAKLRSDLVSSYRKSFDAGKVWNPSGYDRAAMLLLRKVPNTFDTTVSKTNTNTGAYSKANLKMVNTDVSITPKLPFKNSPMKTGFDAKGLEPSRFREADFRKTIDQEAFQSWRQTVKPYYGEKVKPIGTAKDPFEIRSKIISDGFAGLKSKSTMTIEMQLEPQINRVSKPYKDFDAKGYSEVQNLLNKGMFREAELVSYKRGLNIEVPRDSFLKFGEKSFNRQPRLTPRRTSYLGNLTNLGTSQNGSTSQNKIIGFTTNIPNKLPDTTNNVDPLPNGKPMPDVLPNPNPDPSPFPNPDPSPFPNPDPSPFPNPDPSPFPNPITDILTKTQTKRTIKIPVFRLGGGSGRSGGSSASKGKWRKQDNPLKSVNAMLKTFGLGGKAKSSKNNLLINNKVNPFFKTGGRSSGFRGLNVPKGNSVNAMLKTFGLNTNSRKPISKGKRRTKR